MTAEEFRELVQVGDIVRIRTANNDDVMGKIEKILSNDVKLSRLDSGLPCVLKIATIETLDFDVNAAVVHPHTPTVPTSSTTDEDRLKKAESSILCAALPLPSLRQDSVLRVYKEHRDIWRNADRMISICNDAEKNGAIFQKAPGLLALAAQLRENYPEESALRVFLGDVLVQCGRCYEAVEDYLAGEDAVSALACAQACGDSALILRAASACLRQYRPVPEEAVRQLFHICVQQLQVKPVLELMSSVPALSADGISPLVFDGLLLLLAACNSEEAGAVAGLSADLEGVQKLTKMLTKYAAVPPRADTQGKNPAEATEKNKAAEQKRAPKEEPPATWLPPVEGSKKGQIGTYYPLGFGFISPGGMFFRLEQVEDDALRAELTRAKVLRKKWDVTYTTVTLADGKQRADHIRLIREDAIFLEKLGSPELCTGSVRRTGTTNYVLTDKNGQDIPIPLGASVDAYLTFYLKDESQREPLPVSYVLTRNGKGGVAVAGMWLKEADGLRLAKQYPDSIDPSKVKKVRANLQVLRHPSRAGSVAYKALSIEPVQQEQEAAEPTEEPKLVKASTAEAPKLVKVSTVEEEREQLQELLKLAENHFETLNLPNIAPEEAYKRGLSEKKANRLKQAEPYLYKAVVSSEQAGEALANLLFTYLQGKEDKLARIGRGLYLLDLHHDLVTQEKYNTIRINMMERGGFELLLAEELRRVIRDQLKPSAKMHYCQQLGRILLRHGNFEEAASYLDLWKETKEENATLLGIADGQNNRFSLIEPWVNQSLAICCYYIPGRMEQAKTLAAELLRDKANPVADQIISGTLSMGAAGGNSNLSGEDDIDYIYDAESEELTPYVQHCLQNAKIFQLRQGELKGRIVDNTYKGTPEEAMADVDMISHNKYMSKVPFSQRSDYWAMTAKIVYHTRQAYRDEEAKLVKHFLTPSRLKEKLAHYLLSRADFILLQEERNNLEFARFLYMECIPMFLEKNTDRRSAFMRMVSTLVQTLSMQAKAANSSYSDTYLTWLSDTMDPNALRELLYCTFLVDDRAVGKDLNMLLKRICDLPELRKETKRIFEKLGVVNPAESDRLEVFLAGWQTAKALYQQKQEELIGLLRRTADNMEKPQALSEDLQQMNNLLTQNLLFPTDYERLQRYCTRVLSVVVRLQQKDSFEQKRDDYRSILRECETLANETYSRPTKLTYEHLNGALEVISGRIGKAINELYRGSTPILTMGLSAPQAYVDEQDRYARIEIEIRNRINLQPAVLYGLRLTCVGTGAPGEARTFPVAEVRGGEQVSQEWGFCLEPGQLEDRYFDIEAELDYGYYSEEGQEERKMLSMQFNVSLQSASDFEPVPNPYMSLCESNGVSDDNMFYGRNNEMRELVAALKLTNGDMMSRQGIVLSGQKRTGKTAIMQKLGNRIIEAYGEDTYIIVEMGSVGKCDGLKSFLADMIDQLQFNLDVKYPDLYRQLEERGVTFPVDEILDQPDDRRAQSKFNQAFRRIDHALQELGGKQKYIPMFFVDEFTYFYTWIVNGQVSPDFMLFWKAFHQDYRICTIAIGMDSMPEFMEYGHANHANCFGCLTLKPITYLDKESTIRLADEPVRTKTGESRFQQDALDYIYELTGGSAYLTVILCNALVRYINDNKTVRVTRTVVNLVLEKRLLCKDGVLQRNHFEPQLVDPGIINDEENEIVKEDNKKLLTFIAENCDNKGYEIRADDIQCASQLSDPTEERKEYLLERLVRRDVLVSRTSNGMKFYKIKLNLLRMWLPCEKENGGA